MTSGGDIVGDDEWGGFDRDRLHEDVNLSTQPNSSSTKSFCVHFVSQRRFGS